MVQIVAALARSEGFFNIGKRAIMDVSFLSDLTDTVKGHLMLEDAQISWISDKKMGRYILRHLLDNSNDDKRFLFAFLQ